ncbi:MAG: hypothetical protein QHH05_07330 [Syntrophomonadaceae bacterium]|jgi:hypothetical protein|nr:hypothetical protein [Syntrophomonadaceae bacterium]MDH7498238.1 hypothetical protein [Syntrophomonadaceae bacterium]
MIAEPLEVAELNPRDHIEIQWNGGKLPKECPHSRGVVEQITRRFIVVRSPSGYKFCVSFNDMAEGTQVRKATGK